MVAIKCICPLTAAGEVRHPEGDTVTLRERLDFRAAATVRNRVAIANEDRLLEGEIVAILAESYLLVGVESWSIVDAKGKPLPVTRETITGVLLADIEASMAVANEADALYSPTVILPLLKAAGMSSPDTPTDASTSATKPSSASPPKPSRRSSTITIPTDAIATTSPLRAGVSS